MINILILLDSINMNHIIINIMIKNIFLYYKSLGNFYCISNTLNIENNNYIIYLI